MTRGRCPGCGTEDASCKKVRSHMMSCPAVAELYKSDPSKVIDPTDEYVRYKSEEGGEEARAEAKDARLAARFAELDAKREEQAARWTPRDVLD